MTPPAGAELLERATAYARRAVLDVTAERLASPTPCRAWNVRALLCHLIESCAALHEAIGAGGATPVPGAGGLPALLAEFRTRVGALIGAVACAPATGGVSLPADVVACTAALELTVHGWDLSRACHGHLPIPAELALDLAPVARELAPRSLRAGLFDAPVDAHPDVAGDRLVAFLGRDPDWG